ncbi:hypothetical protein CE167_08895, partial [Bifidobacterium breve]
MHWRSSVATAWRRLTATLRRTSLHGPSTCAESPEHDREGSYAMTARPHAVIIGMMGAGKTRVGKEVAHMLRLPFADADVEIEHEVGMKIPAYFDKHGEPAFREVEADLIADFLEDCDGIFSLGGGAPMTPSTQEALVDYIAQGGCVVYLDADPKEAMERANRGGGRPMLNGDANARWKKL